MKIRISCPCGKTLAVSETAAGKRVKCPGCGKVIPVPMPEIAEEPEEPDEWISDDTHDPYAATSLPAKPTRRTTQSKSLAPSAAPVSGKKKRQLNRNGKLLVQIFVIAGSLGCVFGFRPNGVLPAAFLGGLSAVVCAGIASTIAMLFNMVEE